MVLMHPFLILAVSWTFDGFEITKGLMGLLRFFFVFCCLLLCLKHQNLNKLASLVRGKLAKLERSILTALITIDVHARDTVTNMVNNEVGGMFVVGNIYCQALEVLTWVDRWHLWTLPFIKDASVAKVKLTGKVYLDFELFRFALVIRKKETFLTSLFPRVT